ncbi:hypothetical protein BACI9J_380002 [Bacillus altitudinis]|nr:hypothetical protein BACI9J_380002 [Bacillus altitudinis]
MPSFRFGLHWPQTDASHPVSSPPHHRSARRRAPPPHPPTFSRRLP